MLASIERHVAPSGAATSADGGPMEGEANGSAGWQILGFRGFLRVF